MIVLSDLSLIVEFGSVLYQGCLPLAVTRSKRITRGWWPGYRRGEVRPMT
jgi:hypothetical protein